MVFRNNMGKFKAEGAAQAGHDSKDMTRRSRARSVVVADSECEA